VGGYPGDGLRVSGDVAGDTEIIADGGETYARVGVGVSIVHFSKDATGALV
jgi:hypothetical protein